MATAKAASEPSMEEILASIRKIIADEDTPETVTETVNDQAAIDEAFGAAGGGEEMSADDVDALFDTPAGAPEEEIDRAAIDAAFDTADMDDNAEMSADDVDALFDASSGDDDDDDDVLALSPDQTVPSDEDEISFNMAEEPEVAPKKPAPVKMKAASVAPKAKAPDATLLSDDAVNAVKASFGALNSAMTVSSSISLEDLMKSMLRPMLKQWLDENLPEMVERMVQAEIQRMRGQ